MAGMSWLQGRSRGREAGLAAAAAARGVGVEADVGQRAEVREGGGRVRDGVGGDEMLLEARLDGGLDLVDAGDERLDLAAGGDVEERDAGAGAGGVAGGGDAGEVAVGDHAEDHGVARRDVRAEGAGEHDAVDGVGAELVHQQAGAGVEGGFRQLDGADVALGDEDVAVQAVGVGAALRDAGGRCRSARRSR